MRLRPSRAGRVWVVTALTLLVIAVSVLSTRATLDLMYWRVSGELAGGGMTLVVYLSSEMDPWEFYAAAFWERTWNLENAVLPRAGREPGWWDIWVVIPMWLVCGGAVAVCAVVWWHALRVGKGHCRLCGYNLTGNTSGRCPECGRPVEQSGSSCERRGRQS